MRGCHVVKLGKTFFWSTKSGKTRVGKKGDFLSFSLGNI
jgi:hypothetical protein